MGFFARIGRVFRGFFGLFARGLEERNPEALMEAARSDFRSRMASFNQAIARMAGIAERLKGQIKTKTEKAQELERRIVANNNAGNLELAGSLARELQELQTDLAHDKVELEDTEQSYQANLRQAQQAQKDFEEKIRRLERQLSQVKVKEAQAEAAAGMSNVAFKVGDMGDTMSTVEEVLAKRYETSAGKARLAQDMMSTTEVAEKENERKALEKQALADFLANRGIAAKSTDAAPAAQSQPPQAQQASGGTKDIGPA